MRLTRPPNHRVLQQAAADTTRQVSSLANPQTPLIKPPEIVRAEANLLRFPFFALHTKGLRNVNGVECTGRKYINGKTHTFTLSITRNTKYLYPGPLSRSTHFALLDLMRERGFPYSSDPITWETWTELSDRMDILAGGSMIAAIKDALRRTAGILIVSNYALTTEIKGRRYALPSDEFGYHLYDSFRLRNDVLHDGTVVEQNSVTLSDWYLSNLNGRYWGPLDYPTWLAMNKASPIASRLYEFFLFNFSGLDTLCIDYQTLCSFLPVKPERFPSQAERQLEEAFAIARRHDVICDVRWGNGKRGQMQLHVDPSLRLVRQRPRHSGGSLETLEFADDVTIRELRSTDTPAALIVRRFHEFWSGNANYRPEKSELRCADKLVEQYGRQAVERLLPKVVSTMQKPAPIGFPDAKYFGASAAFFHALTAEVQQAEQSRRRDTVKALEDDEQDARVSKGKATLKRLRAAMRPAWEALSQPQRMAVEEQAYDRQNSAYYRRRFKENAEYRLQQCLDVLRLQSQDKVM